MSGSLFIMDKELHGVSKPCNMCGTTHSMQSKCSHNDLMRRIQKLLEANSMIPSILQANKEAVETAKQFQILLKIADKSNEILQQILLSHGEVGEKIKEAYMSGVNEWVKEYLSQDINQQASNQSENTIPSETESKLSTMETMTGESIGSDSSK